MSQRRAPPRPKYEPVKVPGLGTTFSSLHEAIYLGGALLQRGLQFAAKWTNVFTTGILSHQRTTALASGVNRGASRPALFGYISFASSFARCARRWPDNLLSSSTLVFLWKVFWLDIP